jgi:hypothetical protein
MRIAKEVTEVFFHAESGTYGAVVEFEADTNSDDIICIPVTFSGDLTFTFGEIRRLALQKASEIIAELPDDIISSRASSGPCASS